MTITGPPDEIHELRAEVERLTAALDACAIYGDEQIADNRQARAEIERLTEAHERIVEWSRAYPLTVFPEPDLKLARELLEGGGMTLDAISASAMRHVIEQVAKISHAVLEPKP